MPLAPDDPQSAALTRRLAALAYEVILSFAVVVVAGLAFPGATGNTLSGASRHAYQAYALAILCLYYIWCWRRGGQTLPMLTWKLRLISRDGGPVTSKQALLRFVAACFSVAALGLGFFWALFDRDGQFLHDRVARTKIIDSDRQVR